MVSPDFIFWEVDVQRDFMLPGGNLYVPGAEKLLPNIRRLTDAARQGKVFLVSHGCFHTPDDPEFKIFPPHCVKGTPGSELVPEALTDKVNRVENTESANLPENLSQYKQILLEKQTLNIFESQHADKLVERLGDRAANDRLDARTFRGGRPIRRSASRDSEAHRPGVRRDKRRRGSSARGAPGDL